MDLRTVVGWVLTLVLLFGSMAIGVGIGPYIDVPSVMIVFGGTIGVMMVGFKMETLKSVFKFLRHRGQAYSDNLAATIKRSWIILPKLVKTGYWHLKTM